MYCTDGNEFKRRNTADFSFEETNEAAREIVTEKNKRVNTDGSKQGNAEFVCNDCDAVYRSKSGLQQHTKIVHDGERFGCNLCKYKVTRQDYLTRHIQSVHEGVRYECNQCEYKATQQNSLNRRIHEGMRYGCNQCEF